MSRLHGRSEELLASTGDRADLGSKHGHTHFDSLKNEQFFGGSS